jgi:hypothetical protein
VVPSAAVPPAAPVLPPILVPVPPVVDVDFVGGSTLPAPAPVLMISPAEPFKLPPIVDAKAYLNLSSILQFYLRCPEFFTLHSDDALITDSRNAEASAYWDGKIRLAVQDRSLCFLFKNKGLMYDGKGFEILAALNQHCHPDTVANEFTTLLSLFNDSMGESEEIMAFRSQFDGMINNMAHCKIVIPPILMVMFFLRLSHPFYDDLLEQFWLGYESLEGASLDLIVADVCYHEAFKILGSNVKVPAGKTPKVAAAAASSAIDKQGKQWGNPYMWLASFNIKSIKKHWMHSLAGTDFFPYLPSG